MPKVIWDTADREVRVKESRLYRKYSIQMWVKNTICKNSKLPNPSISIQRGYLQDHMRNCWRTRRGLVFFFLII